MNRLCTVVVRASSVTAKRLSCPSGVFCKLLRQPSADGGAEVHRSPSLSTTAHVTNLIADEYSSLLAGTSPISNPDLPDPSSAPSPSHLAASTGLPRLNSEIPETNEATMLSTLTASALIAAEPHNLKDAKDGFDDHADNRSSSLSELGDASDEHSEPTPRPSTAVDLNENENDSEAETERLENTPRKLTRTATETSLASEQLYQRTPSKLAQSRTIDQEESAPPTPSITAEDAATIPDAADGTTALQALSIAATTEADNLAELAGRKRKRSSADNSSLEEQADEPARKRSGTAKDSTLNCDREGVVDSSAQADAEEELEIAEERISQLAQEEVELEVRQAEIAVEAVNELTTVAKHAKPRKGGRRGKRKVEDMAHSAEALSSIEGHEGEGDGDNEEEDSGAVDEEGKYPPCNWRSYPSNGELSGQKEACDR